MKIYMLTLKCFCFFLLQPSHYVAVTNPNDQTDATMTDVAAKTARIKQLVGQLQNNLCNVSVMSDPDLDSLSNMDPNSLVDITGKDFMEQLKDSGRLGGEAQMWWLYPPSMTINASHIYVSLFFCDFHLFLSIISL